MIRLVGVIRARALSGLIWCIVYLIFFFYLHFSFFFFVLRACDIVINVHWGSSGKKRLDSCVVKHITSRWCIECIVLCENCLLECMWSLISNSINNMHRNWGGWVFWLTGANAHTNTKWNKVLNYIYVGCSLF